METITTLTRYDCAYELLEEFCGAEFWDDIDSDDDTFLRHFDDFEGYNYFCINGNDIIVAELCGDVVRHFCDSDEFIAHVKELLAADREDR